MTKKVAIVQSNYIPWKGYFDLIAAVDEFIIFDDMQYTRRDWRNRNLIKTPKGLQWLTVPVKVKGNYHQPIKDIEIDNLEWQKKHWQALEYNYKKAPFFKEVEQLIAPFYLEKKHSNLSELNQAFIRAICEYLNIKTEVSSSADYQLAEGKTERLVDLCRQAKAVEYISGPAAKDYLNEDTFKLNDLTLTWFSYSGYESYPQLWGEFNHGVTILDLLFNCGDHAAKYMKYSEK